MKNFILVLAVIVATAMIAAGKSTKLVASWKNPEYSGPAFHRILVIGMSAKPGVRADFEDALSKLVARDGVEALPGNTILLRPEDTKLDLNYLKTQVKEFKIDAVIVSRLIKVDKTVTYIPGQPYMPFPTTDLSTATTGRDIPWFTRWTIFAKTRLFGWKPMSTPLPPARDNWYGQESVIL